MIYVFGLTIIITFIRQKDKLLKTKKNLAIYLMLSFIGLGMGVVYMINPYLPSISMMMEKYVK